MTLQTRVQNLEQRRKPVVDIADAILQSRARHRAGESAPVHTRAELVDISQAKPRGLMQLIAQAHLRLRYWKD